MRSAACEAEADNARDRRVAELEHCVRALAHDLRSPLVSMLGFARLLRQDYRARLDDTALHFIDRIEEAGLTMEALIDDLLDFSRIGSPSEPPSLVDPLAVLRQIQAEYKPRFEATHTQLDLPDDAPLVFCERTRLYQIFSNLLRNALEHMGECENPRIRVAIDETDGAHRISVSDNGRGVPSEECERIFELFRQGRSRGRRGSGMGLAIVRKITESQGGRAWVESEAGAGATFFVTLPKH